MKGAMINLIAPYVLWVFNSKAVKELVVKLLEKYAKSTDNDVDDVIVAAVKRALFPEPAQ
jgi:hypothetical protein